MESILFLEKETRRKGILEEEAYENRNYNQSKSQNNFDCKNLSEKEEDRIRKTFAAEKKQNHHSSLLEISNIFHAQDDGLLKRAKSSTSKNNLHNLKSMWFILIDSLCQEKSLNLRKHIGYPSKKSNLGLLKDYLCEIELIEDLLLKIRKDLETEVVYGFMGRPFAL